MHDWWPDELDYAGEEHLDAEYVAGYERKAGFDPRADVELLRTLGLDEQSTVVDFGAGTGVFAIAVASLCRRVFAVDVSPAMVDVLRRKATDSGVGNLTVARGGFLSYDHDGEPADFVFSRNALHQLPDFWKGIALARVAAILKPGGVLRLHDLVYDFDPSDADAHIEAWFAGATDDSAAGWTADELAEHVRIEFSTYTWLLEPLLERTGFDIVDRRTSRGAYAAYTCRRR